MNGMNDLLLVGAGSDPHVGSIFGAFSTPSYPIVLPTLGTTDWAAWGVSGGTGTYGFVDKSGGGTQISNVTTVSMNGSGSSAATFTWTGGTPVSTGTAEGGTIYSVGSGSATFTVPAGLTSHTLVIFTTCGVWSSGTGSLTLTASLSDGSATPYTGTQTQTGFGNNQGAFTITFSARSNSQTLTVEVQTSSGNTNACLSAAYLI